MPPKDKKKRKEKPSPTVNLTPTGKQGPPPKPKKIPPPPDCFTSDDLVRFKTLFKEHDEDNIDKVPIGAIPLMLRRLGFNPKTDQINWMYQQFLEDDLVDTVEFHEFLQMIEAKLNIGDDFELVVTKAMAALGHDDEAETSLTDMELLREELFTWGEPLQEIEFVDWLRMATKDKTYNMENGTFNYVKFIENMNSKDMRYVKEPINFFKLDQKTLAEMAIKKAAEEKEEQERKEVERKAKEEAKRQKMIADGLISAS